MVSVLPHGTPVIPQNLIYAVPWHSNSIRAIETAQQNKTTCQQTAEPVLLLLRSCVALE